MEAGQGDKVRCVSYEIETERFNSSGLDCYMAVAIDPKTNTL